MSASFLSYWVIVKKEVLDNLRDRRTLTTMGLSIVIGPLLMFALLWFVEKTVEEETDLVNAEPIEIGVIGHEHAPNLLNWLRQNNIEPQAFDGDVQASIQTGEQSVVLKIEPNYVEAFRAAKSAPLTLFHDGSLSGLKTIGFRYTKQVIERYSSNIGSLRLLSRGINPQIAQALKVNLSDVAPPSARNTEILNMMPYLIIIFIMVGGLYLAIDTTAGERENGSLEPLLAQPVSRSALVLAKLTATIVFSAITFLLVLIGLALAFKYMPIESITIEIEVSQILFIFLTCLPFVFAGCAAMVLLASFTKSYKEAQSYLSFIMLLPSLPLILLGLLSPEPSTGNMWVPSLSQGLIIIETLKGEMIPNQLIGLSILGSMLLGAVLTFLAVKLYQRERLLG